MDNICFEKMLPVIVAVLYSVTGLIHARKGQYAMAGVWLSYAVANIFFIMIGEEK